jgi:type IV pilus assembly protein PilW
MVLTRHSNRGLSMVELMVAMALSLVIALAAVAALTAARTGFNTVDEASQLRDNARFVADLIYRLAAQTGYQDPRFLPGSAGASSLPSPSVQGFNNALYQGIPNGNTVTTVANGLNGSDVLVLRSQGDADDLGNGSVIDCRGSIVDTPDDAADRSVSVLHVQMSQGHPSLMCATRTRSPGTSTTSGIPVLNQPIIQGVENFQVLYGVDQGDDSVAERYLRADQVTNWGQVRSLRIGVVVRGMAESTLREQQILYPFGMAGSSAGVADGSAFSSAADVGSRFVAPNDGRMRQTLTFTVHLRNDQGL